MYFKKDKIKIYLIEKILDYINKIQNKAMNNLDITILVNEVSELNMYLIYKLAREVRTLKIVTPNIYKFKKPEEKLYSEDGIAIQLSNSYKRSLLKSKIIINLDFSTININEYNVFNNAIIINITISKLATSSMPLDSCSGHFFITLTFLSYKRRINSLPDNILFVYVIYSIVFKNTSLT